MKYLIIICFIIVIWKRCIFVNFCVIIVIREVWGIFIVIIVYVVYIGGFIIIIVCFIFVYINFIMGFIEFNIIEVGVIMYLVDVCSIVVIRRICVFVDVYIVVFFCVI